MNESFEKLAIEKKRRILNAGFSEFSKEGYKKASTNKIVELADISKGTLYYYFKNKKALYLYLIEYGIQFLSKEFVEKIDEEETDFIEKYKQIVENKLVAYRIHPEVFLFFASIYLGNEETYPTEIKEKIQKVTQEGYLKLYKNLDENLFRDDIEMTEQMKMIHWLMEGYQKELYDEIDYRKNGPDDYEKQWEKFHEFLDSLKKLFYKSN
ncbi:TetR/AcrR family transcriptional regulator [Lacticigenium naphthae]|uniref:TetR/AcrR family transcriptional regulator n=1 Tax=Lacticigenium naphthae TaxID=515351 RepID=UPI000413BA6D|nr:TetR/AcrR family transcriptional regulator [Lacticigenium naphthae]